VLPPWVIVLTKSTAEEAVERSLRQAGYRAYLPRYRRLLLPHGFARRPANVMRPLFARLVFVQDWRGWPRISIGGATGLMQSHPGIAKLCDADIALIMERERRGDFDMVTPEGVRDDLAVGDEVEFEAAFGAKVMGILEELTPQGKAIVAAMIFGRIVRTEVGAANLNKVYGVPG
jgi:transcription antitermination factor NusG